MRGPSRRREITGRYGGESGGLYHGVLGEFVGDIGERDGDVDAVNGSTTEGDEGFEHGGSCGCWSASNEPPRWKEDLLAASATAEERSAASIDGDEEMEAVTTVIGMAVLRLCSASLGLPVTAVLLCPVVEAIVVVQSCVVVSVCQT